MNCSLFEPEAQADFFRRDSASDSVSKSQGIAMQNLLGVVLCDGDQREVSKILGNYC